jgi:hypothetical protein
MGKRCRRVEGVAPVRRVDGVVDRDDWAELIDRLRRPALAPAVRVSPVARRELPASAPAAVEPWPRLPECGVVVEIGSRR